MLLLFLSFFAKAQTSDYYLLVGTYTDGKSTGIYVYKFNTEKITFTYQSEVKSENPSYLAISKNQKFVYAVNENGEHKGAVSSFSFDKANGQLHFFNTQLSEGDHPCYVTVDASGKNVIAANYSSGNIAVFKTKTDGSLTPIAQNIVHQGKGIVADRQEKAHAHSANFTPDGNYVLAADLGNDRLYQYKFDSVKKEVLSEAKPAFYTLQPGSGPRHFEFHPNKKYCYLLNELTGKVAVYNWSNNNLKLIQTITSDSTAGVGNKGSADIHLTPNGKFLYTSNRAKANDITVYKVGNDGKLSMVEHVKVGLHPRNFTIDPSGKLLLVANRDSNTIQVFKINASSGKLEKTDVILSIDKPVCLKMVPVK